MKKNSIFLSGFFCTIAAALSGCLSRVPATDTFNTSNAVEFYSDRQHEETKFDVKSVIDQMADSNFECGESDDAGIWVVLRVDIAAEDNVPANELATRADLLAKKTLSEWLGTEASSQTSLDSEVTTVNGKTEVYQQLKSKIRSESEAFLRGLICCRQFRQDGDFSAWYYATTVIADRTADFEAQLRAAPPGVVRAVGFGIIADGKIPPAKRQATQSALQNAVEQVMGTTVIGQSQLMDNEKAKSKLISQTAGQVKEFRIVKEDKDGANYFVILNAKVDEKSLLDNYAAIVRSMGNPGFIIECDDPDLKAAFSGFLADLGFKVVTDKEDAVFIVDGDCKYLDVNSGYYGQSIQIDLKLRLIDKNSGQEFFTITNEPRWTTSYSASTISQCRQESAKKAFNKMREELHGKLNKVVMDWVLNGREVQVVFNNLPAGELDEILTGMIDDVPCAKYQTRSRDGNKLILHCSYVGPSADFEEFLQRRFKKDLPGGIIPPETVKIDLSVIEFNF